MADPFSYKTRPNLSTDAPRDEGGDNAPVVIAMGAAAVSGFIMGLLVRGEFATSAFVFVAVCVCSVIGWWARGIR